MQNLEKSWKPLVLLGTIALGGCSVFENKSTPTIHDTSNTTPKHSDFYACYDTDMNGRCNEGDPAAGGAIIKRTEQVSKRQTENITGTDGTVVIYHDNEQTLFESVSQQTISVNGELIVCYGQPILVPVEDGTITLPINSKGCTPASSFGN